MTKRMHCRLPSEMGRSIEPTVQQKRRRLHMDNLASSSGHQHMAEKIYRWRHEM
jgi:hypothetical protein